MSATLGVIPARIGSTRLPKKVIANLCGKTLISYVIDAAKNSRRLERIIVATDSQQVKAMVERYGIECWVSSSSFASGTDRTAFVAKQLNQYDLVINIQADEPFLRGEDIDLLVETLEREKKAQLGTLAILSDKQEEFDDPDVVKVVKRDDDLALYFSRSPIPYNASGFLKHIGIYGYRRDALLELANTEPTLLEKVERLEQLRALQLGYNIIVGMIEGERTFISVDTPEDLKRAERELCGPNL